MEFIELKNIVRKDSPIHYINEYHGLLVFNNENGIKEHMIEIILEKTALGLTNIQLHFTDKDLLANIEELRNFIDEKNKQGYFE